MKAVKNAVPGTTVNDVVLAVCAGALRRYLQGKGELPAKPLVAMAPISIRQEDERGAMGNQVSAMLVRLATDEADPAERSLIHEGAIRSKGYHRRSARTLTDYTHFIPLRGWPGGRLYTRMRVADAQPALQRRDHERAGAAFPLYLGDARLVAHLGAGPTFDGMGLFWPFSAMWAGGDPATSCREIMPDVDVFVRLLGNR